MGKITAPALLSPSHDVSRFVSGVDTLDEWLIKRAWKNQQSGASRTFVLCEGTSVTGYYALASGSIERAVATGNIGRNMPDPIPVIVLGRLAVDARHQGQRLGAGLLRDAIHRVLLVSEHIGIRALMVHAISDGAKRFYQSYGFQESPNDPMTLFLSIEHIMMHSR